MGDVIPNTESFDSVESIMSLLEQLRLSRTRSVDIKDELLIIQFLEYASTHLTTLSNSNLQTIYTILREVNEMLSDKVYLIGCKMTVVDTVYYRLIYPVMSKFSIYDKENFVNVSRWFNHLQNDDSVRQSKSIIAFNRTLLYV